VTRSRPPAAPLRLDPAVARDRVREAEQRRADARSSAALTLALTIAMAVAVAYGGWIVMAGGTP